MKKRRVRKSILGGGAVLLTPANPHGFVHEKRHRFKAEKKNAGLPVALQFSKWLNLALWDLIRR
jgi:hypothetical protein